MPSLLSVEQWHGKEHVGLTRGEVTHFLDPAPPQVTPAAATLLLLLLDSGEQAA